jgi:hypothetical protein
MTEQELVIIGIFFTCLVESIDVCNNRKLENSTFFSFAFKKTKQVRQICYISMDFVLG